MSWQDFKSLVATRGLIRSSHYEVEIPFPSPNFTVGQISTLFCESTNLPGMAISTTPSRFYGEVREMPYEPTYDTVQMSFYVDAQMVIKNAFDDWMGLIINPNRRSVQYYRDYVRNIKIKVTTTDNQTPYTITLYEAYPKAIGSIQMSSEQKDIIKLPVTFQYKYWRKETRSISYGLPNSAFRD